MANLQICHQHIPDGDDMTDGASENKEVEHGVHILRLVQRIEYGSRDIADALSDDPDESGSWHRVDQRLKGHKHAQTHTYEAERLQVGVLLQPDEADNRASQRTGPHEDKKTPTPVALFAQSHQCQRRIRAGNMPVDSCMVPLAQAFLPFRVVLDGVIERRGNIGTQHSEKIEDYPHPRPVVVAPETPYQEDDAEHHPQQDSPTMRRGIPYLLFLGISNHGYRL